MSHQSCTLRIIGIHTKERLARVAQALRIDPEDLETGRVNFERVPSGELPSAYGRALIKENVSFAWIAENNMTLYDDMTGMDHDAIVVENQIAVRACDLSNSSLIEEALAWTQWLKRCTFAVAA